MLRKIIQIDEDKCTGCGICVDACHEGAIGLVNGKAKLMRDDYCDGLGDCLPTCPTGAISFIEKDTLAYDEEAVKKNNEAFEAMVERSEVIKEFIEAKKNFDAVISEINGILNYYITGQEPGCTHDCSCCSGGCH